MTQFKAVILYILALIVLLAPAIILGWIGLTLLSWPGLIIGILGGLMIFSFSVNKIAAQEEVEEDLADLAGVDALPVVILPARAELSTVQDEQRKSF